MTQMHLEASQAAEIVARQLAANASLIADLATRLKALNPSIIFTCARGSSDHAATYAKYLFETRLRIPTLSQAPSLSSIYGGALLHMKDVPFILISQSGHSPDLLLSAEAAKAAGALVIALVNDVGSPLAKIADIVVPLHAGPETSVAATKSYVATLAALAQLAALWSGDEAVVDAVNMLPKTLAMAWNSDWSTGVDLFQNATSLFVLGRGVTLGIAQEAALKLKETCGIHGEAFSAAEVAHGPMALVKDGFPMLIFPPLDLASFGLDKVIARFEARGAHIALVGAENFPIPPDMHPTIAPIAMIQSFYRMVNALAVRRGYDPDHPPMLSKVTQTR